MQMEERLHNWAAGKRKQSAADMIDFAKMDAAIKKLPEDEREVIAAIYLNFPYQSIYFVAAEINMPPSYINRCLEKAKAKLGN